MTHKKLFFILPLLLLLLGTGVYGQDQPIRVFTAEPILASARAAALGDAYISDPYDVNSFYWNPASLAFLKSYSINANSIVDWHDVILKNSVAVPWRINKSNTAALGLGISYQGYLTLYNIDFGYAKTLSSSLSAGVFFDVHRAESRNGGLWGGSGTLGFLYAPSPGVSYALVYRGIGRNIRYHFYGTYETLDYVQSNRSILIGTTFLFPSISRKPYISINLAAEKLIGIENFISKAGIEIWPVSFLALRCGIVSGPTYTRGSVATGRAGLGLSISRFRLDYGITPGVAEQQYHQVSFAFAW